MANQNSWQRFPPKRHTFPISDLNSSLVTLRTLSRLLNLSPFRPQLLGLSILLLVAVNHLLHDLPLLSTHHHLGSLQLLFFFLRSLRSLLAGVSLRLGSWVDILLFQCDASEFCLELALSPDGRRSSLVFILFLGFLRVVILRTCNIHSLSCSVNLVIGEQFWL